MNGEWTTVGYQVRYVMGGKMRIVDYALLATAESFVRQCGKHPKRSQVDLFQVRELRDS